MNSRLNRTIRERHGFCYTVECQYTPLTDTGVLTIYAGVELGAVDHYLELLHSELRQVSTEALPQRALQAAQQQLSTQMAIGSEGGLNEMQSIGKSLLVYDRVDTLEEMQRDVAQVTAGDLVEAARDLLQPGNLSVLTYT